MLLKGTPVATGVARGTAYVLVAADHVAAPRRDIADIDVELARFEDAMVRAEADLSTLEKSLRLQLGPDEADIFAAQALLVRSSRLVEPVRALVREQRINVE